MNITINVTTKIKNIISLSTESSHHSRECHFHTEWVSPWQHWPRCFPFSVQIKTKIAIKCLFFTDSLSFSSIVPERERARVFSKRESVQVLECIFYFDSSELPKCDRWGRRAWDEPSYQPLWRKSPFPPLSYCPLDPWLGGVFGPPSPNMVPRTLWNGRKLG